jgi:transcriptional accessory protein Tex/SPT6
VSVRVLEVNLAKNQIALTMKQGADARPQQQSSGQGGQERRPQQQQRGGGQKMPPQKGEPFKNDALRQLEQFKKALKGTVTR